MSRQPRCDCPGRRIRAHGCAQNRALILRVWRRLNRAAIPRPTAAVRLGGLETRFSPAPRCGQSWRRSIGTATCPVKARFRIVGAQSLGFELQHLGLIDFVHDGCPDTHWQPPGASAIPAGGKDHHAARCRLGASGDEEELVSRRPVPACGVAEASACIRSVSSGSAF